MNNKTPSKYLVYFLFLLGITIVSCTPTPTQMTLQAPVDVDVKFADSHGLTVSAVCSQSLARKGTFQLKSHGKVPIEKVRIDFSLSKTGFDKKRCLILDPVSKEKTQLIKDSEFAENDISLSQLQLDQKVFSKKMKSEQTLEVDGLEPGVTYFYRILIPNSSNNRWISSHTLRLTAPICPLDNFEK